MASLLIKLNLRSVWYLFCLFSYTYKASPSAAEFKNQESIAVKVPPDEHNLGHAHHGVRHAGPSSVIRSRRAEQFSNLYHYSVHNFSTTTIISPPFVSIDESSLQWVGSPPYQVSHVHLQLHTAF